MTLARFLVVTLLCGPEVWMFSPLALEHRHRFSARNGRRPVLAGGIEVSGSDTTSTRSKP